jgi:hypothetical protein
MPRSYRVQQVLLASLLGLVLGLEVAVIFLIPGWVEPEGMTAGVVWGGIVFITGSLALLGSLVAGAAVAFTRSPKGRKVILAIGSGLLIVLTLVILILPGLTQNENAHPAKSQSELLERERELREQYEKENP